MKIKYAKIKVGNVFWDCSVFEGKVEFGEWIVRSIQNRTFTCGGVKRFAYLTKKNRFTWIKRSKKVGDYGWNKNINRLHKHCIRLSEGDKPRSDLYVPDLFTNRLQAAREALKMEERVLVKRFDKCNVLAKEHEQEIKTDITALKRAIMREKKKCRK